MVCTEECLKLVLFLSSFHLAHFSVAGEREGWMGLSPKVVGRFPEPSQPCTLLVCDWYGLVASSDCNQSAVHWTCAWFWRGPNCESCRVSLTDPFSSDKLQGCATGLISKKPIPSSSASTPSSIQSVQTAFTSHSIAPWSTRQP